MTKSRRLEKSRKSKPHKKQVQKNVRNVNKQHKQLEHTVLVQPTLMAVENLRLNYVVKCKLNKRLEQMQHVLEQNRLVKKAVAQINLAVWGTLVERTLVALDTKHQLVRQWLLKAA